mgnify:CR=1 FL=1
MFAEKPKIIDNNLLINLTKNIKSNKKTKPIVKKSEIKEETVDCKKEEVIKEIKTQIISTPVIIPTSKKSGNGEDILWLT